MTKEQKEKKMMALSEEINKIQSENESEEKKKGISVTKLVINGSYAVFVLLGIYASFANSLLDIDKYIKFLSEFAVYWAPLVLAYAGGSSYSKYTEAKKALNASETSDTAE